MEMAVSFTSTDPFGDQSNVAAEASAAADPRAGLLHNEEGAWAERPGMTRSSFTGG